MSKVVICARVMTPLYPWLHQQYSRKGWQKKALLALINLMRQFL